MSSLTMDVVVCVSILFLNIETSGNFLAFAPILSAFGGSFLLGTGHLKIQPLEVFCWPYALLLG